MGKISKDLRKIKKLLIFALLFFLMAKGLLSFDYELMPLRISFNGAVNVNNHIIVYGDFGSYLISTDLGRSWQQKFIGVFDEIRSMANLNDTLFGCTYNGYFIISIDRGLNWILNKVEIESGEKFLKILATNEGIYVRGIRTIYKLDRRGKIIKRVTSGILEPTRNNFIEGDPDEVNIPINRYFNDDMYLFEDKIIMNSDSFGDSGFVAMNVNLDSIQKVVLINKIRPWKDKYPQLVKVLDYGNQKLFVLKSANIYTTDSIFSKFNYFYKDTLFMNFDTTYDAYKHWLVYGFPQFYFTAKDSLFIGRWYDSTKYDTIKKPDGSSNYFPYYQFRLYSVRKYIPTPKDTFVIHGNPFYDVYNASFYFKGNFEYPALLRRIETPSLVINDSIWIYVHRKRFLLITADKGYSWKLISYLSGLPYLILNDTTYFFVMQGEGVTEINRTSDGGITFLPSKTFLEGYKQRIDMPWFYSLIYFYLDSTGTGFLKGLFRTEYAKYANLIYKTYNFWETYSCIPDSINLPVGNFRARWNCYSSNIVKFDDSYLLASSCDPVDATSPFSYNFLLLDSSLTFEKTWISGSHSRIYHIMPSNSPAQFIYFAFVNDSTFPQIGWFEIRSTVDTGKSYIRLHKIVDFGEKIVQFYQHNTDSVFFTTSKADRLYLYDRKSNELKILWSSENGDFEPKLMVISDRFYIVGRGLFLE
ncbi:MAG: WD40/YVTN/BNR-like repeat-containing protein, partial [Candidatus Kapaibacteriota bacterium]